MPRPAKLTPAGLFRAMASRWTRPNPHFKVSIELHEGPDLLCSLHVFNPGPAFTVHRARLLSPRNGLIYRREAFLSGANSSTGFSELRIERRVGRQETLQIPFEVWAPSWDRRRGIELAIDTSLRWRRYICRPAAATPSRTSAPREPGSRPATPPARARLR